MAWKFAAYSYLVLKVICSMFVPKHYESQKFDERRNDFWGMLVQIWYNFLVVVEPFGADRRGSQPVVRARVRIYR